MVKIDKEISWNWSIFVIINSHLLEFSLFLGRFLGFKFFGGISRATIFMIFFALQKQVGIEKSDLILTNLKILTSSKQPVIIILDQGFKISTSASSSTSLVLIQ